MLWRERCSLMVLACGTVPCLSLFLARYPHLLLKAEGVSSESPLLPWYVEASQNGQAGSVAVVHPSCRGRGPLFPLLCLRKDPEPPPIPSHSVLMCPPTRDSPAPLAQYTSASHPCSKRSLPRSPSLGQGCYALACPWEEDLLLSPFPVVAGALPLCFLTVN